MSRRWWRGVLVDRTQFGYGDWGDRYETGEPPQRSIRILATPIAEYSIKPPRPEPVEEPDIMADLTREEVAALIRQTDRHRMYREAAAMSEDEFDRAWRATCRAIRGEPST